MEGLSENELIVKITEVGNKLLQPPKCTLELLNLLEEVEFLLAKVGQAPSHLVKMALLIPMKALIADELFRHLDSNVRITIASCLNEVTRISAPIPPFDDDTMREMFKLIVSTFENLSCQPGRRYSKAVLILQSIARLRSCVMMLDIDCGPLVTKMFELFHRIISPKHPQAVLLDMVNIMSVIVQESDYVSLELLKVLLDSIKMENQSVSPASWELGTKVLEECAYKLRPFIVETVSSMPFCLEDYAPILSSICKPEPDTVMKVDNDSSLLLVIDEPANNFSHPAEYVQALEATKNAEYVNASRSQAGRTASKRRRNQKYQNLDEEVTGVQCVQDLDVVESFDCDTTLGTVKTASKREHNLNSENVDEEPTGPQYVQALEIDLPDYVEALEAAERLTSSGGELNLNLKNLDEATDCEREHKCTAHGDINKNNGIITKAFQGVREEADVYGNKQAYHSTALCDSSKRKRGRPRKKDFIAVSEDTAFKNIKQEFSNGSASERGTKSNSKNVDGEAICLENEPSHQSTAEDDITKNNGMKMKDVAFKEARKEADVFEMSSHSPAHGDSCGTRKRGRPRKKDFIAVSEDKNKMGQPTDDKFQSNDPFQNQRKLSSSDDEVFETPHGSVNYKEDLVGCRIKVWWPMDHSFYKGTVTSFDASVRKHKVDYDDGDEELLNIRKERWEFIGDATSNDIESGIVG